jgi:hypothetical protein
MRVVLILWMVLGAAASLLASQRIVKWVILGCNEPGKVHIDK